MDALEVYAVLNKKIKHLVNDAPEALDTLKEVADWIAADEAGLVKLTEQVEKNSVAIDNITPIANETVAGLFKKGE